MFCDTCPALLHLSEHQPERIYTDGGRVVFTVCGDCHADIKADNVRTDNSRASRMFNACISRHYRPPNSLLSFAEGLSVSGSFLGSWF